MVDDLEPEEEWFFELFESLRDARHVAPDGLLSQLAAAVLSFDTSDRGNPPTLERLVGTTLLELFDLFSNTRWRDDDE